MIELKNSSINCYYEIIFKIKYLSQILSKKNKKTKELTIKLDFVPDEVKWTLMKMVYRYMVETKVDFHEKQDLFF